jgi:hypothetical protein
MQGARQAHTGRVKGAANASRRIYTLRALYYIERARHALTASREEKPMRAEVEKLVEAIRDSLELLRRHL